MSLREEPKCKIFISRTSKGWQASTGGKKAPTGYGYTPDEAVGDLIRTNQDFFQVQVAFGSGRRSKTPSKEPGYLRVTFRTKDRKLTRRMDNKRVTVGSFHGDVLESGLVRSGKVEFSLPPGVYDVSVENGRVRLRSSDSWTNIVVRSGMLAIVQFDL